LTKAQVVAHRGSSAAHAENSSANFEAAVAQCRSAKFHWPALPAVRARLPAIRTTMTEELAANDRI
jgi:hypothetical protein